MTRIAFISDIHANLEALKAVLQEIDNHGADTILCLGDIVGYGPNPKECLDIIRSREIQCVKGNHDDYVSVLFDMNITKKLRDDVKTSIAWTQEQLDFNDMDWLAKLPESLATDDFNIIHGSNTPNHYNYCRDEESIKLNFQYQQYPLTFCGHSHSPLLGLDRPEEEVPLVDYIRKQTIPAEKKVVVNVGSVGQPRDSDPRACIVYFEYEERKLSISRIQYDVKATQEKIMAVNLPAKFAQRLAVGR